MSPGDLFIAIVGDKFDGHDFLLEVAKKGAAAFVISRPDVKRPKDIPTIVVKDTVKALGFLARYHRRNFAGPVIAITGSAGKTTTKNLVSTVLKTRYRVLSNEGTKNNHMGVPQTLLALTPRHDCAVIECGTNQPGDIAWLATICEPDIVIMTNIGESHLALLKSPARVFAEKAHLVSGMKGTRVIFNQDNVFLRTLPQKIKNRHYTTYGCQAGRGKPDYLATDLLWSPDNRALSFRVNRRYPIVLKSPALSNVANALAALSCGRLFNIPYSDIIKALKSFVFKDGRLTLKKVGWFWLIDDSYNANPVSMRNALMTLGQLRCQGRKICVCADMLELGAQTVPLHRQMGRLAGQVGVTAVFAIGPAAAHMVEAAQKANQRMLAKHFSSIDDLNQALADYIRAGDLILVKGSRGMKMERAVSFLTEFLKSMSKAVSKRCSPPQLSSQRVFLK